MNEESKKQRVRVLLEFQGALCRMVTANLAQVLVAWNETRIIGRMYYFESPNDVDIEVTSDIEGEVMAAFPDQTVEITAVRLGESEIFPDDLEVYTVFARWIGES